MKSMILPRVAVLIVNWNGGRLILDCLASLRRVDYPSFDIVVIDNGSTDGSLGEIAHRFDDVVVIEAGENLGFVGANNLGMRWAIDNGRDFVMLLNHDTEVASDFLGRLVDSYLNLESSGEAIGAMGPLIKYARPSATIWSAGGQIDWERGVTHMVGMDQPISQAPDSGQVDFVTGCCMLLRADVLERCGLLDERFFAYYEEVEWCVRMSAAGYQIWYEKEALITHKITAEARQMSPATVYYMTRNQQLFLQATAAGIATRVGAFLTQARTVLSWQLRPKWRRLRPLASVKRRALLDYMSGRYGRSELDFQAVSGRLSPVGEEVD